MEMNSLDSHSALRHQPGRHRTVDPAGQENHALSVRPQRQTAETLDFVRVNICLVFADIDVQNAVRMMNIYAQHLAML